MGFKVLVSVGNRDLELLQSFEGVLNLPAYDRRYTAFIRAAKHPAETGNGELIIRDLRILIDAVQTGKHRQVKLIDDGIIYAEDLHRNRSGFGDAALYRLAAADRLNEIIENDIVGDNE